MYLSYNYMLWRSCSQSILNMTDSSHIVMTNYSQTIGLYMTKFSHIGITKYNEK